MIDKKFQAIQEHILKQASLLSKELKSNKCNPKKSDFLKSLYLESVDLGIDSETAMMLHTRLLIGLRRIWEHPEGGVEAVWQIIGDGIDKPRD